MQLDIGRSVTYPFEDPRWASKLIVFLIVGFIPGLNVLVWGGYALSVARNLMRGTVYPLPAWDAWSAVAVRGLLSLVGTALYFSPALMVLCCMLVASWLIGGRAEATFAALRCVGIGLGIAYILTISYLLGGAHMRFAQTDQFHAYLDIGGRFQDMRDTPGVFGMLLVYQGLLTFVIGLLTVVAALLFLVALSLIATAGDLLGIGMLFLLAVGLLGYVAFVTVAFLASGYILGMAGRAVVQRVGH
mgnify:CR=1 FL=1